MTDTGPGRPLERKYPPRIDATPKEIARAVLQSPPPADLEREYTCRGCGRVVFYPETIYRDGQCAACTAAPVQE